MTRSALLRHIRILPAPLVAALTCSAPDLVPSCRLASLHAASSAPESILCTMQSLNDVCSFVAEHGCVYNIIKEEESTCPAP